MTPKSPCGLRHKGLATGLVTCSVGQHPHPLVSKGADAKSAQKGGTKAQVAAINRATRDRLKKARKRGR